MNDSDADLIARLRNPPAMDSEAQEAADRLEELLYASNALLKRCQRRTGGVLIDHFTTFYRFRDVLKKGDTDAD